MIPVRDAKILVITLLFLTLMTNVTRGLFGNQGNLVVDLVFLTAVVLLLHLNRIRYSTLLLLFLAYVVGHAAVQFLTHGGLSGGNNYTDYRNFLRGGVTVLLLLNTNFKSEREVNSFFASVFVVIATFTLIDVYGESFAYYVLKRDLRSLFYVEAAYRGLVSETTFGDPTTKSRIPTLLGAPHHMALTQAALVFVFWHLNKQGYVSRAWFYLTLGAVLLAQSRLQVFVVFGALALPYLRGFRFTRGRIWALCVTAVALILVIRRFGSSFVLTYSPDFVFAYDLFVNYGSLDALKELIEFPSSGQLHNVIFGVGGVTGSQQYNHIISLANVEIGLITEIIPKYGLVFAVLYYAMLWRAFVGLRRHGNDLLALALIPFMAAPLHMWLVNGTFVSDMFFVVLAYCLLVIRAGEDTLAHVSLPRVDPIPYVPGQLAYDTVVPAHAKLEIDARHIARLGSFSDARVSFDAAP
jgi:hypothetical protein